ncbi:MAG: hypothetical protein K2N16_00575, partial [Muribaculaceae bacterium]|nr:hypothetical protein [Muribaculaceae bacterium]
MRKKLTLFAALLVAIAFGFGVKALGWTSTDPAVITDGTYYIYNVGHEQFLHQGNSWGTRASLFPEAYACHVVKNADGTLKIQPLNGGNWLGDNAYMDNGTAVNITATAVEGGYKLANGSKALAWDGNEVNWVENAEGANATWQILTADELKSGFASVTADKPVDATFMIKGPRLLRVNDEWQNSWTSNPAPGIRIEGDGQGASAEVWNNSVSTTQEVDLVKGTYMLTVEGFYRNGGKEAAIAAHNDGTEQLLAYLVAGDAKTPLMSICDGKNADLNNLVNDQATAGKQLLNGDYHNALYFRVENDGPVTIGVKKDEKVGNDWTVFNCFSLTYYGPNTTIDDLTKPADASALKIACEGIRTSVAFGFEAGEYAPYNNVASMETLLAAEALAANPKTGAEGQAEIDAMLTTVQGLTWTPNDTRLDAVYDGNFHLAANDGAPAGWRMTNSTIGGSYHSRAFVLTEGMTNYEQLAAFQPEAGVRGALFLRFDGTNSDRGSIYIYGQGTNTSNPSAFCMPLKAGVCYNFSADMGGWGSTGRNVKIYIVDAAGATVGEQTIAPTSDCSKVGGTADHFAFEFTPTVDGNCLIYIQCPGGYA